MSPTPSCPSALRPQHHSVWSKRSAHECEPPVLMCSHSEPPTSVGSSRSRTAPSPSCPSRPQPQHHSVLSECRPQVCPKPPLMWSHVMSSPPTCVGRSRDWSGRRDRADRGGWNPSTTGIGPNGARRCARSPCSEISSLCLCRPGSGSRIQARRPRRADRTRCRPSTTRRARRRSRTSGPRRCRLPSSCSRSQP